MDLAAQSAAPSDVAPSAAPSDVAPSAAPSDVAPASCDGAIPSAGAPALTEADGENEVLDRELSESEMREVFRTLLLDVAEVEREMGEKIRQRVKNNETMSQLRLAFTHLDESLGFRERKLHGLLGGDRKSSTRVREFEEELAGTEALDETLERDIEGCRRRIRNLIEIYLYKCDSEFKMLHKEIVGCLRSAFELHGRSEGVLLEVAETIGDPELVGNRRWAAQLRGELSDDGILQLKAVGMGTDLPEELSAEGGWRHRKMKLTSVVPTQYQGFMHPHGGGDLTIEASRLQLSRGAKIFVPDVIGIRMVSSGSVEQSPETHKIVPSEDTASGDAEVVVPVSSLVCPKSGISPMFGLHVEGRTVAKRTLGVMSALSIKKLTGDVFGPNVLADTVMRRRAERKGAQRQEHHRSSGGSRSETVGDDWVEVSKDSQRRSAEAAASTRAACEELRAKFKAAQQQRKFKVGQVLGYLDSIRVPR